MVGGTFFSYLEWYFFEIPRRIFGAIKNFLNFGLHYFSIPFLLKTLFSHWRKYFWYYPRGFDIAKIFDTFFSNLISRFLGAIVRSFLILIGLVYEILVSILGLFLIFFWYFLPFFLIFAFFYGVKLLFSI